MSQVQEVLSTKLAMNAVILVPIDNESSFWLCSYSFFIPRHDCSDNPVLVT